MTATSNLEITLVEASQAQKEVTVNEAVTVLDAALSEVSIAMTDANYTLSTSTVPQEWQYRVIKLTGALTANRNIVVPTNKKEYTLVNATSGGYSITLKTSGGTGIAVSSGVTSILRCDGTNVVAVTPGAGVGSGDVSGPGSSTNNNLAVFSGTTGKVIADSGISVDTDTALAANSDSRLASQKAVKTYVDGIVAANDAMVFKGATDCSGNPNYPAADRGHTYRVSVAGKIGGASGVNVEVGDLFMCLTDGTSSGAQGAVGSNWTVIQTNIDGAVVGPASSTDGHVALFDGASGKLIKDSGLTISGTNTGDETTTTAGALINGATSKTTPVDADYIGLMDSAASNILKKVSWANIKATLSSTLTQPFDVSSFYPGIPGSSAKVMRIPIARAITFAANFAGSYFTATANATASTVFDVQKNGSSIGSVTIGAGGTTATFATSGGTSQSLAAGDILAIIAPGTADATLADPAFTLVATR
jgi:hypothetical protein